MSTKEVQEKILDTMKKWKKLENTTVALTGKIIENTDNPIVRLVMEIIQRDSQMHYRVQELIADSLERTTIALQPEELAGVWDLIEKHIKLEKESVDLATTLLDQLKGRGMPVQGYLLSYLMRDESKHDTMLEELESIKNKMYPYG